MKAALYVRVSTDKQEADNQLFQLKDFCERQKWEIYKVYTDIISGKEQNRPEFDKLFQDSYKRLFDVVLFWDLSRFSRAGTHHTLSKLKELESLGIKWHSYQDAYLSTLGDFKDVVISILSTLAKIEREKIGERTKAGLQRALKEGKKLGRPKISEYQIKKIKELYKQHGSINKVSKETKISYGKVYEVIKKGWGKF